MKKGPVIPTAAPPADRFALLRLAQQRHAKAVETYEAAQEEYIAAVGALPLPELMQGPVVRVTDLTTIEQAEKVLQITEDDHADFLIDELRTYRLERDRLAEWHGIADLAEIVALTACAVAREGRA